MQKKRIVFEELDKNHADLILKLRSKGLTQKIFFQTVVRSFIDDDPALVSFFEEVVKSKTRFGKKTLARIEKSAKKGRETERLYSLTDEEKENIFDILEAEEIIL